MRVTAVVEECPAVATAAIVGRAMGRQEALATAEGNLAAAGWATKQRDRKARD